MDALDHPDPRFRATGATGTTVAPPPAPPAPADQGGLTASKGLVGLLIALIAGLALVLIVMIGFAAAGVRHLNDNHAFEFAAAFVSDFALVAVAWFLTAQTGGPPAWKLGFRRFKSSAFGWMLLAFGSYL